MPASTYGHRRYTAHRRVVVVGLGNPLHRDDGVGIRAISMLQEGSEWPSEVEFFEGGMLGRELLPYLADATHWLIIRAARLGHAPGTIRRLEGHTLRAALSALCPRQTTGIGALLQAAQSHKILPHHLVVWTMEPAAVDWGMELTPCARANLHHLLESVRSEVQEWLMERRLPQPVLR